MIIQAFSTDIVVRMNTSYGLLFVKPQDGFMMDAFLGLNHWTLYKYGDGDCIVSSLCTIQSYTYNAALELLFSEYLVTSYPSLIEWPCPFTCIDEG